MCRQFVSSLYGTYLLLMHYFFYFFSNHKRYLAPNSTYMVEYKLLFVSVMQSIISHFTQYPCDSFQRVLRATCRLCLAQKINTNQDGGSCHVRPELSSKRVRAHA